MRITRETVEGTLSDGYSETDRVAIADQIVRRFEARTPFERIAIDNDGEVPVAVRAAAMIVFDATITELSR
jgi:hypothetical protein